MSNKKKIAKFLREEAKKLAPEQYTAYHKYYIPQKTEHEGKSIIVYGEMETHDVNHARRMRKIYQKEGVKGVNKYFEKRGFKLIPKDGQSEINENDNLG